ncbi:MAG: U32 family peptidase [Dehalococcoidales bacterium]|nr:U32 family peptidase [Dehalococcoidales bacterium]
MSENVPRRPELLSPAGNWDCMAAAVANGADAVYLGTKEFNARINARNFSLEELARTVTYCHEHGVRVYLTLNTLVKNHETRPFFDVLAKVYSLGVDGVIIQHISFLELIKKNFPGLKVFISTQAAIGNTASASLVKSADRVILPRELCLDEIKRIIDSGVNVEIFVHGALCFSYSGLCLFSSMVDNRSGNRGQCAQLCRQKYNGVYPLSTKELCLVRRIPELIQAGISGFKIEGRMRSALYVAVATRLYRKAIDSYLGGKFEFPAKEMAEIEVVFNRQFTGGFPGNDTDIVSPERPMNRGAFLGVVEGGEVAVSRPVARGDGVGIWSNENVGGTVIHEMFLAGKPVTSAATGERVNLGLDAKDGTRIYLTSSRGISPQPGFEMKRPPVILPKRPAVHMNLPQITGHRGTILKLLVKVYSLDEAREASRAGADIVFYNIFAPDFPREWEEAALLGAYLPRIMNDEELGKAVTWLRRKKPLAIMTGNLGFLASRSEFRVPVYLDYSLNCFNDFDWLFFQRYDVTPILSPELSLNELSRMRNKEAAVFCHGDIVLVNTLIEIKDKELVAENTFPVRREGSYRQILNSHPYGVFNDVKKLRGLGFSQFFIDKAGEGAHFAALYRNMLQHFVTDRRLRKGYTSGHLYRPVD